MKTPLAWLQLTHEKVPLLVALAGIGFADILIFMQLGFRRALFESATLIHQNLDADLVLISPQSETVHLMKPFSHRRLYQALNLPEVKVLTHQEFIDFKNSYWATSTPIGFIFLLGAGMGFVVGIVIVYQILYSDVSDHLPEYATLKAMGYTHACLLVIVLQEALILAFLGYILGFTISFGLYILTQSATKLPFNYYYYGFCLRGNRFNLNQAGYDTPPF